MVLASKCKKPDDTGVAKLLKPQADVISQITQFRESNRRSAQYNHLSTISESIAALSWVVTVSFDTENRQYQPSLSPEDLPLLISCWNEPFRDFDKIFSNYHVMCGVCLLR